MSAFIVWICLLVRVTFFCQHSFRCYSLWVSWRHQFSFVRLWGQLRGTKVQLVSDVAFFGTALTSIGFLALCALTALTQPPEKKGLQKAQMVLFFWCDCTKKKKHKASQVPFFSSHRCCQNWHSFESVTWIFWIAFNASGHIFLWTAKHAADTTVNIFILILILIDKTNI